jgi:hypothetical protein
MLTPTDPIAVALLSRLADVKEQIASTLTQQYVTISTRYALPGGGWGLTREQSFRMSSAVAQEFYEATSFSATIQRNPFSTDSQGVNYTYGAMDSAKINETAERKARETCLEWHAKLLGKLGAVESCQILHDGGYNFRIQVCKAGIAQPITIMQQIVWKVAKRRGNWFAQFPSRIYVGGTFVPEKKFREMCAAI